MSTSRDSCTRSPSAELGETGSESSGPPMPVSKTLQHKSPPNSFSSVGVFPVKAEPPKFEIPTNEGFELPSVDERRRSKALAGSKCSSARLRRSKLSNASQQSDNFLITQPHTDEFEDDDSDIFASRVSMGRSESEDFHRSSDDDSDLDSDDNSFIMAPAEVDIENGEGFDTDVEVDEKEFLTGENGEFDATGVKDYIKECNKLGVIPVSYFQKHIQDRCFTMKYHGLGPLGAKAIAKPLEANTIIETLNLEGNHIEGSGAVYIGNALRENLFITELNLGENELRTEGCKLLCEVLSENTTVEVLVLSGNKLKDCDGEWVYNLLINNHTIRKLNLDHNEFEVTGARWVKDALLQNETLKILDLSWNNIRLKGAEYIGEMVQENYGLKYLDLRMNGLADMGANAIGHALMHNQCLLELNMSDNRITKDGALSIARGLVVNDELNTIRMGFNTIGLEGALSLLMAIDKNESPGLALLDITNVVVPGDFEVLQEKIEKDGKTLEVIHGGVLYMPKRILAAALDPEEAFEKDPMTKLKKYAARAKIRLIDLFRQFDVDNSWTVTRDEFIKGVRKENMNPISSTNNKSTGLDLTEADIDLLIAKLDQDGDGEIDYGELVDGDQQNRQDKYEVMKKVEERKAKEKEVSLEP